MAWSVDYEFARLDVASSSKTMVRGAQAEFNTLVEVRQAVNQRVQDANFADLYKLVIRVMRVN